MTEPVTPLSEGPFPKINRFASYGTSIDDLDIEPVEEEPLISPFLLIVLYNTVMSGFEIMSVSFIAYWTSLPFIFPSLGPEAFLHFAIPDQLPASPRNSIFGHFFGCLWGYIGLIISGLADNPYIFDSNEGVSLPRVGCLSFAIGMTCGSMILFNCSHPPAGATTLIVALGILKTLQDLSIIMASVIILCIETYIITFIFRRDVKYPIWSHDHCNYRKEDEAWTAYQSDLEIRHQLRTGGRSPRKSTQLSIYNLVQRQLSSSMVFTPTIPTPHKVIRPKSSKS